MIRKPLVATTVIAVSIVLVDLIGSRPAWAPPPPVTFVGNVSCNLQGTITITPAAFNASPGSWMVTFAGHNNACVGLPSGTGGVTTTTPLTQGGVHLTHSTDTFSFTAYGGSNSTSPTLCADLEHGGPLTASAFTTTIHWLGSGPITPTGVSFSGATAVPGIIELLNGTNTNGSFAGTTDILLGYNLASVFTQCGSTLGLSHLPVNHLGGDNLMVGPAF